MITQQTVFTLADLDSVLPEVIVAVGAMILLVFGVFRGDSSLKTVALGAVLTLVAALLVAFTYDGAAVTFQGAFAMDGFARFAKILILIGAILTLPLALDYFEAEGGGRFEFPILVMLAVAGMMIMVSANDLITLYTGLELQSLSLYVLAAIRRDDARSTEAGLKYFVLGALSSGMLLYGASMVYGFSGTTLFDRIANVLQTVEGPAPVGLIVGLVFLIAGLAFKVSAVPFHMWTPDVYEGSPTAVTAFFAAAPKVAAMALFLRTILAPFGEIGHEWLQVVWIVALASMILGSLAAIGQTNIKRLLAYSSIGHIGFALVGLAAASVDRNAGMDAAALAQNVAIAQGAVRAVLIYMAIYLSMTIGAFCVLLALRAKGELREDIGALAGLSKTRPALAFAMAIFMFSLAGIPPLAGFWGKFYVFMAAIDAGLYVLAVAGVLSSVIGAYYYLRIVKLMYFDEPTVAIESTLSAPSGVILAGTSAFNVLFILAPAPLVAAATVAAQALIR
ncbi:NADH-quinone oxidoreductase subunit NuoN [Zavarzinia sp. CC-PAN008]|uniref:NADH-quinone oxidoreductase subunit NuoN n=1 Tax=Zavarzinia sp. CC-PAN008 TaxID=3243332 RepID=UPI003F746BB8